MKKENETNEKHPIKVLPGFIGLYRMNRYEYSSISSIYDFSGDEERINVKFQAAGNMWSIKYFHSITELTQAITKANTVNVKIDQMSLAMLGMANAAPTIAKNFFGSRTVCKNCKDKEELKHVTDLKDEAHAHFESVKSEEE